MDCASVILGMFVGAFAVAIFALLINLICKRPMTSNLSVSVSYLKIFLCNLLFRAFPKKMPKSRYFVVQEHILRISPNFTQLYFQNFRYPAHLVRTRPPTPSPRYFDVIVENSQNPTAHDNFLTAFPPQTQLQTPSQ